MQRKIEPNDWRCYRQAFSLLEVIAAVVILGVVAAATVATIAPLRAKSGQRIGAEQLVALNSMSQMYFLELGDFPPYGVSSLVSAGYLSNADREAESRNASMRSRFSYNRKTGTFTPK
jgi:general secretion pathway protein G